MRKDREGRPAASPSISHRLRILVVEDNRVNQILAVILLEREGHSVSLANNGAEALDILEKNVFDLVLMDMHMPEMDGLEATRILREKEQFTGLHVPVIAVTASAMKGDDARCVEAGMDGYLSKPLHRAELLAVVARFSPSPEPSLKS